MAGTSTQAMDILRRLNPITASPSSAIETAALLDSFGYSLMPRTSVHQGMAAGLATLMGRAVGVGVERATDALVSPARPLPARLAARAALGGCGRGSGAAARPRGRHALACRATQRRGAALGGFCGRGPVRRGDVPPAPLPVPAVGQAGPARHRRDGRGAAVGEAADGRPEGGDQAVAGGAASDRAGRARHRRRRVRRRGGADPRVCRQPERADPPSRPRVRQERAWPGQQRGPVGRRGHLAVQRRGRLHRTSQRAGRARLHRPADLSAGLGQPGQPVSLRGPRAAGTPVRHRRGDPGAHRAGAGRARQGHAHPGVRRATTPSRCTRPAGRSWRWRSWSGPGRSTAPICCWCRRPGPVGWTRP